jgi:hypothetical protein
MRLAALLALAAAATSWAMACKSSSTTPSGPPATDFARFLADAWCDGLARCCGGGAGYDDAACRSQMSSTFQAPMDRMFATHTTTYDASAAAACATTLRAPDVCSGDAGLLVAGSRNPLYAACARVFVGSAAPGDACDAAAQCATSDSDESASCVPHYLATSSGEPTMTCDVTRVNVAPGDTCSIANVDNVLYECDKTLGTCDFSADAGVVGTCKAYAKIGDGCVAAAGHGTTCDPATSWCDFAATQKCVPLPKSGDACDVSQRCAPGLVCTSPSSDGGSGGQTCGAPPPDAGPAPNPFNAPYACRSPGSAAPSVFPWLR